MVKDFPFIIALVDDDAWENGGDTIYQMREIVIELGFGEWIDNFDRLNETPTPEMWFSDIQQAIIASGVMRQRALKVSEAVDILSYYI